MRKHHSFASLPCLLAPLPPLTGTSTLRKQEMPGPAPTTTPQRQPQTQNPPWLRRNVRPSPNKWSTPLTSRPLTSATLKKVATSSPRPLQDDSAKTAVGDLPFWKTIAEAWRQDQLNQARSRWQRRVTSRPPSETPPTPPSSSSEASTEGASKTKTTTYSAEGAPPHLATATANRSPSDLSRASTRPETSSAWPPRWWRGLREQETNPDPTLSSTTSRKTTKKPRFPSPPPRKTRGRRSAWRYVTEEEWKARQTVEEEFHKIAAGMTHLGPCSARRATLYPRLQTGSTAT